MSETTLLVRYGAIPFVSRFRCDPAAGFARGMRAVVRTSRGPEIGTILEAGAAKAGEGHAEGEPADVDSDVWSVLRTATREDEATAVELKSECEAEFAAWCRRIKGWNLDLELIDLEWTLDRSRLILYVLNERGPDCTKLALQFAAAGLGLVDVQPVDADGLVQLDASGGGCGAGGCGRGA